MFESRTGEGECARRRLVLKKDLIWGEKQRTSVARGDIRTRLKTHNLAESCGFRPDRYRSEDRAVGNRNIKVKREGSNLECQNQRGKNREDQSPINFHTTAGPAHRESGNVVGKSTAPSKDN